MQYHLSRLSRPALVATLLSLLSIGAVWGWHQRSIGSQSPYRYSYTPTTTTRSLDVLNQELRFYQTRLRQHPDSSLDRTALAQTYLKMAKAKGDAHWYLQAEQMAQISRSQLPFNNPGAMLVLARVAEAKHDFTATLKLANQVLTEDPQNESALGVLVTSYLAQGKLATADRVANQLLAQTPTLGVYTLRALVDVAQGKEQQAKQHFQQAIAAEELGEQGSSAYVRVVYGRFLMERGQLQPARQLLTEAHRLSPQDPAALVALAKLETREGRYQTAEQLYSQIFKSKGVANLFDHAALAGVAELHNLQGNQALALEWWTRAETFLRQHQELRTFGHQRELAQVLLTQGKVKDRAEALFLMQSELKIRRDAQTLNTMAWALSANGRWQDAQTIIQEALATGIQDASLYYRAAQIAQQLGQGDLTQQYRQIAQKLDPTLTPALQHQLGVA